MDTPAVDGTGDSPSECLFDVTEFQRLAPALAERYASAKPFPHVVVDGLLRLSHDAMASFPASDWNGWRPVGDVFYQPGKVACDRIEVIPEPFSTLIEQLSHPSVLQAIETITGIKRLLPDPYLHGGGLHMSGPGGILKPHTDFHNLTALDLYRRLNLLLYLNDDWTDADGGCLEFGGEADRDRAVIVPTWGRCVVFGTDERTVHGFPVPVAAEHYRRSIALYYYTATDAARFSGGNASSWRDHGPQTGLRRIRFGVYRGLELASRGLSVAAYIANPNVGAGVSKRRH